MDLQDFPFLFAVKPFEPLEQQSSHITLWPLTDVAITLHLAGSGGPHADVLLGVPMNHHHTVSLFIRQ